MQTSSIQEVRIALDKKLLSIAFEEWEEESQSGYKRIKSFGNTHSLAVIKLLSSLPNSDRNELLKILPKRSREYSQRADPSFFCAKEQCIVASFVAKIGQLSAPHYDGNEAITEIFCKHNALRKEARPQAIEIRRSLFSYLKNACKEWDGFNIIKPEPNMITFERNSLKFRIAIDWDLRPWEISCGFNVYEFRESLISNHTFFGGLGISASPAWYADEVAALQVAKICANHALKVSQIITNELDTLTKALIVPQKM